MVLNAAFMLLSVWHLFLHVVLSSCCVYGIPLMCLCQAVHVAVQGAGVGAWPLGVGAGAEAAGTAAAAAAIGAHDR